MDLNEAIHSRRSVRAYKDEPLTRETVDKLIRAAVQAPSASNRQPWAFVVIQGNERLQGLSERAKQHRLTDTQDPPSDSLRARLMDSWLQPVSRRGHAHRHLRHAGLPLRRGGLLAGRAEPHADGPCAGAGDLCDRTVALVLQPRRRQGGVQHPRRIYAGLPGGRGPSGDGPGADEPQRAGDSSLGRRVGFTWAARRRGSRSRA